MFFQIVDSYAQCVEFVPQGEGQAAHFVGLDPGSESGVFLLHFGQQAGDHHSRFPAGGRAVALKSAVRVAFHQALGGKRRHRVAGPMVFRYIGEQGSRQSRLATAKSRHQDSRYFVSRPKSHETCSLQTLDVDPAAVSAVREVEPLR